MLISIGHVVIDGLAQRLGIRLSSCRGGFTGKGKVFIGPDTLVELTLYKSSMSKGYYKRIFALTILSCQNPL